MRAAFSPLDHSLQYVEGIQNFISFSRRGQTMPSKLPTNVSWNNISVASAKEYIGLLSPAADGKRHRTLRARSRGSREENIRFSVGGGASAVARRLRGIASSTVNVRDVAFLHAQQTCNEASCSSFVHVYQVLPSHV